MSTSDVLGEWASSLGTGKAVSGWWRRRAGLTKDTPIGPISRYRVVGFDLERRRVGLTKRNIEVADPAS